MQGKCNRLGLAPGGNVQRPLIKLPLPNSSQFEKIATQAAQVRPGR